MSHCLRFDPSGKVDCLYTEAIDLRELGQLVIVRATTIEFNPSNQEWDVRAAGDGMVLHSHSSRDACLRWELLNLGPG